MHYQISTSVVGGLQQETDFDGPCKDDLAGAGGR
jgi:hypothetical protein